MRGIGRRRGWRRCCAAVAVLLLTAREASPTTVEVDAEGEAGAAKGATFSAGAVCTVPFNGVARLATGAGQVLNDVANGISTAVVTLVTPAAAHSDVANPLPHKVGEKLQLLVEVVNLDPIVSLGVCACMANVEMSTSTTWCTDKLNGRNIGR
jgi:hypothetical protein